MFGKSTLSQLGFPKDDRAGGFQPRNRSRVPTRADFAEEGEAEAGRRILGKKIVFDAQGNAMQRSPVVTPGELRLSLTRRLKGFLRLKKFKRLQSGIKPLDTV